MRDCSEDQLVCRSVGFIANELVLDTVQVLKQVWPDLAIEYSNSFNPNRKQLRIRVTRCEADLQAGIVRGAVLMYQHLRMEHVEIGTKNAP